MYIYKGDFAKGLIIKQTLHILIQLDEIRGFSSLLLNIDKWRFY